MNASQRDVWERYGREHPYYGVLTWSSYRGRILNDVSRDAFFSSGYHDVKRMMSLVRRHTGKAGPFDRILEFGCGVGRMALAAADYATTVVGVDVSRAMCDEATRNRDRIGINNVVFTVPGRGLSPDLPPYDLIFSYIVFQHIPVAEGLRSLDRLLDRLKPGGVAVLHFTCHPPGSSRFKVQINYLLHRLPLVRNIINALYGWGLREPAMQMNAYPFGEIIRRLQAHGITRLTSDLTNHGGWRGVAICFVKPANPLLVAGGSQAQEGEDQQPHQQSDAGRGEQ